MKKVFMSIMVVAAIVVVSSCKGRNGQVAATDSTAVEACCDSCCAACDSCCAACDSCETACENCCEAE